jgi:hypothetical protein
MPRQKRASTRLVGVALAAALLATAVSAVGALVGVTIADRLRGAGYTFENF